MDKVMDLVRRWTAAISQSECQDCCAKDNDRGESGDGLDPNHLVPSIERYKDGMWYDTPLLHVVPGDFFRMRRSDGHLITGPDGQPMVMKATSHPMIGTMVDVGNGPCELTVTFAYDETVIQKPPTETEPPTESETSP